MQNAVYESAFGVYFAALCGFLENAALVADRGVPVAELTAVMPGMAALLLDHLADADPAHRDRRVGRRPGLDRHAPGRRRAPAGRVRRGAACSA